MTPSQNRVAFYTLGCKLNFSETSSIAQNFRKEGFQVVDFQEPADIYVINTCSVTDHADRKCKKVVRDALKQNEDAKVAIVGCYAQLKPKEIAEIPGVDVVLGAREKFNLIEHLNKLSETEETLILNSHIKEVKHFENAYSLGDRTRSFLKVQDGCNYFCSFCTIPLARGRSRSDYVANICESAKEIAANGVKEIVLTGVNIGDFKNEKGEIFFDLIRELEKVEGIKRYRISSIEPNLLTNEIIDFVAHSEKFVPHFHIPLQSGSDYLLKQMRRRYLTELFANRIHAIKTKMPDCCIGVDVIVGFPGETEEEFMKTYDFLKGLDISYLHVFTYSERPNTPAARMEGKVHEKYRTERRKMLQNLSHKKRRAFYEQFVGQTGEVLFEDARKNGLMQGYSQNYLKVKCPYDENLVNTLQLVRFQGFKEDGALSGYLLEYQPSIA